MGIDAFRLDKKIVLVTGAGKGIGKATAQLLAEQGAKVVCLARSQADIEDTANSIRTAGGEALAVSCDVTDEVQLKAAVEKTVEHFGGIDILVNNAGAAGAGWGTVEKIGRARFEDTLTINLTSAYVLTHLCVPHMRQREGAAIVNVSSALSWMVDKRFAAYGAAKAGLNQMTRILSYELAPNIRVNAVAPGAVETPSTRMITDNPSMRETTERWIPLKRMGKPEELALSILFLASPASSFITGKILDVDGGMQALPGSAIAENLYS